MPPPPLPWVCVAFPSAEGQGGLWYREPLEGFVEVAGGFQPDSPYLCVMPAQTLTAENTRDLRNALRGAAESTREPWKEVQALRLENETLRGERDAALRDLRVLIGSPFRKP